MLRSLVRIRDKPNDASHFHHYFYNLFLVIANSNLNEY